MFGVLALAGCGASSTSDEPSVETVSQPSQNQPSQNVDPRDIQPDIHTNVPPPGSDKAQSVHETLAEEFFEKKEIFDTYSGDLKDQIAQNMAAMPKSEDLSGGEPMFLTLLGATTPINATSNCDVASEFLCIDAPLPENGFNDVFTVAAGIDVIGRLDLNQLAVFGSSDPVAVVSVFNNDTGGSASEVPIMPEDIENVSNGCTPDDCVGKFATAVALGGAGKFTVVVSAYRSLNDGEINDLASKMVTVYRTETPQIEIVEARPVQVTETDTIVGDPVNDGAVISSERLRIKVRLLSAFSPGVQVRFEDYDEDGSLMGFDAVGYVSNKEATSEEGERIYTGEVFLHNGLNNIQIIGANPEVDQILGPKAPPPMTLSFSVTNYFGAPRVKIINPDPAASLVIQNSNIVDQKVEIKFCYTLVPGQEGGTPPNTSDECFTGDLGFGACLMVNGRPIGTEEDPLGDSFNYNKPEGTFTALVTPDFGVNIFQIHVVEDKCGSPVLYTDSGSFIYGVPSRLIQNGEIQTKDTFSKRGLNVDIDRTLLEGDIRQMVEIFLADEGTKDLLLDNFKSTANKPGYVCTEFINPNTGQPGISNGDTSIDFLRDTFELGEITLNKIKTSSDGLLHLGLTVNGMHGEADLRAAEGNGSTFNGMDLGFLPITFAISQLKINLGVAFPKVADLDIDNDGHMEERSILDLKQIPGEEFMTILGDGPMGRPVYVNSNRNPLAAGIELLDWQQGLLLGQFNTILAGTVLCGIESGLNNENSGAFGKATVDLEKPINYDQNFLRFPFDFELFGKALSLDAALHAFKGEIKFDADGIHLRDVPVRVNPGPNKLKKLTEEVSEGTIAAVSRKVSDEEMRPERNITSETHNLGLLISEDVINQALFGATLAGLLELDLDANFYAQLGAPFSSQLLPNGSSFLVQQMDVNLDGSDSNDAEVPVLIRLKADPTRPPMLTFLSEAEVADFAKKEEEALTAAGGGEPGDSEDDDKGEQAPPEAIEPHFDTSKRYFRLAVAGLEVSAFQQETHPATPIKDFCNIPIPQVDNTQLRAQGFCEVAAEAKTLVAKESWPDGFECPEEDLFSIPQKSGPIVSRPTLGGSEDGGPVPIYRVRGNLILHGEFKPISRETLSTDRLKSANPLEKNIFRIKLIPNSTGVSQAFLSDIEVVENHTGKPNASVSKLFIDFLNAAVGDDCSNFNEIKIPIPEKFPGDPAAGETAEPLFPDFDLEKIDLGMDPDNYPEAFIDDNRLYLDLLLFADLVFTGEPSFKMIKGKLLPVDFNK